MSKGYVVRGKDEVDVWYERLPDGDWDTTTRRTGATALSLSEALQAAVAMTHAASQVVVLAVAEDGTETPLPSYEEALATLDLLREFAELEAEGCESLEKGADATASYCCGKRATLLGLVQSINDPASLREYMARPGTLLDEVRRKRAANAGKAIDVTDALDEPQASSNLTVPSEDQGPLREIIIKMMTARG